MKKIFVVIASIVLIVLIASALMRHQIVSPQERLRKEIEPRLSEELRSHLIAIELHGNSANLHFSAGASFDAAAPTVVDPLLKAEGYENISWTFDDEPEK